MNGLTLFKRFGIEAVQAVATLVFDTFTDTNGTALSAHTPDTDVEGGGWTVHTGTIEIQNNRAQAQGGIGEQATIDAGTADAELTCTINPRASESANGQAVPGFLARWADDSNKWHLRLHTSPVTSDPRLQMYEWDAGSVTKRAESGDLTLDVNADHELGATLDGTSIKLRINGGNEISYGSATANQSAIRHGPREGSSDGVPEWDDFKIEVLS